MTLVHYNPNRMLNDFGKDFDSVIDSFFGVPSVRSSNRWAFVPRVDIVEDNDHLKIIAEIPGMEKEDVKVTVEDGILTISGERKAAEKKEEANYIRCELCSGSFSRSFTMPENIDSEKIAADYKNGLLTVSMQKLEKAKPKEIKVDVK